MPNPESHYVKVVYTAIVELPVAISGIADESPLLRSTEIVHEGLKALGMQNRVIESHRSVGVHILKVAKPRKRA